MIPPLIKTFVVERIARHISASEKKLLLRAIPRRAEFTLTNIVAGTQTEAVTWTVPILSDYAVVVVPTCAAAFVGLLTVGPQAGSKTPTGCTLIVANRSAQTIGAATFDVLAFPI